eukprot:scaffold1561_cov129-Cylindrotheca_fusiformis.AAC.13
MCDIGNQAWLEVQVEVDVQPSITSWQALANPISNYFVPMPYWHRMRASKPVVDAERGNPVFAQKAFLVAVHTTIWPSFRREVGSLSKKKYMNSMDHPRRHHKNYRHFPIAKPLFCDFPQYDRFGWAMEENGVAVAIPFATAAKIEPPVGFPNIPFVDQEEIVQEAADGLYEVANAFEALNPSSSSSTSCVQQQYQELLQIMEWTFLQLSHHGIDHADNIAQACEDASYEIEALVGLVQVFEGKTLDDVYGIERIGVFYTFEGYSYDQNYNLNLLLARWMKEHWQFPFATERELVQMASRYGFQPMALLKWLQNARKIAWRPIMKRECFMANGNKDSNKNKE